MSAKPLRIRFKKQINLLKFMIELGIQYFLVLKGNVIYDSIKHLISEKVALLKQQSYFCKNQN